MKRNDPLAGAALAKFTRRTALQMRLAQRVSRKRKTLLDRLLTKLLGRALAPKTPEDDFMRDELVDADIGFSADELDAYARGSSAARDGSKRS